MQVKYMKWINVLQQVFIVLQKPLELKQVLTDNFGIEIEITDLEKEENNEQQQQL